jgi:K+-transporting ATPase ATPase B chain
MLESVRKLDPRLAVANPVMFVVWCSTMLCLLLTLVPNLLDARASAADRGFNALISLTLLATLLFANFAEALAEGIRTGHPQMPEFVFAPDEVDSIIAYLKSIQAR